MGTVYTVVVAVLSAGTLTSLAVGLIRLGRILERLDSLGKEIDEVRSQADAVANRLTVHQSDHWRR